MSKFVILISTLCVLAVASAWIMGGEPGKYSTSISVDAEPDEVFDYLIDGEKVAKWASVVSVESFDEDGSKTRKRIVTEDGEEVLWRDQVLRFKRPENEFEDFAISIRSEKGGFTNTYFFLLKKNEVQGTNIEYRITQSASGLDRFRFPFREDTTKSRMMAEVTKLKSLIESEVGSSVGEDTPEVANQDDGSDVFLNPNANPGFRPVDDQPKLDPNNGSDSKDSEEDSQPFKSLFGSGG